MSFCTSGEGKTEKETGVYTTRLVEEDTPEVIAVGKDIGLVREVRAAGIDKVDAGEAFMSYEQRQSPSRHGEKGGWVHTVFMCDNLGAEMLLDGYGIVCTALDAAMAFSAMCDRVRLR